MAKHLEARNRQTQHHLSPHTIATISMKEQSKSIPYNLSQVSSQSTTLHHSTMEIILVKYPIQPESSSLRLRYQSRVNRGKESPILLVVSSFFISTDVTRTHSKYNLHQLKILSQNRNLCTFLSLQHHVSCG
jgi:hypothetical protein